MLDNRLWILIEKKISGKASEEDLSEINELLATNPGITLQLDTLLSEWKRKKLYGEDASATPFGKLAETIQRTQRATLVEKKQNPFKKFLKQTFYV